MFDPCPSDRVIELPQRWSRLALRRPRPHEIIEAEALRHRERFFWAVYDEDELEGEV